MDNQEDLLPLSALQHFIYCPRQCALIHIEQQWSENRFTAEGRGMHQRAHEGGSQSRGDVRTAAGVRLVSRALGLIGQADVLEFHMAEGETGESGQKEVIPLSGSEGLWRPFPVEYKRGRPKKHRADEVQLCAQAMCLEEMLGVYILSGALFYGATRRRNQVVFTAELRKLTEETAIKLHKFIDEGITPPPAYEPAKCQRCSLLDLCQPQAGYIRSIGRYIEEMIAPADEKTA